MAKSRTKYIILVHVILFIYSFGAIFSKLASRENFLSFKFIFLYGIILFILLIYAIFWQQILKHVPLTIAFANKSITIIWGMIWGAVIFNEVINITMIIGSMFIFFGIYLVVSNAE